MRFGEASERERLFARRWVALGALVAAAAALGALVILGFGDDGGVDRFYRAREGPVVPPSQTLSGRVIAEWSFSSRPPARWTTVLGTHLSRRGDGLAVVTSSGRSAYQLLSPPVRLAPGAYEVEVAGRIVEGGLQLGVLDVKADRWLANGFYWHGQDVRRRGVMVAPFVEPERATTVRVVLVNWAPTDRASTWVVERVRIVSPA